MHRECLEIVKSMPKLRGELMMMNEVVFVTSSPKGENMEKVP